MTKNKKAAGKTATDSAGVTETPKAQRVVLNLSMDQAQDVADILRDSRCNPELCVKLLKRVETTMAKHRGASMIEQDYELAAARIQEEAEDSRQRFYENWDYSREVAT